MGRNLRLLDLFCGGGGAAKGYADAGFEVMGVDINPQPNYPFLFLQADAMTFSLEEFDVIHASPPCQAYTSAKSLRGRTHPDLVGPIRQRLLTAEVPYVIENVVRASLVNPIMLCGATFGLLTYRHRLFESNIGLVAPKHLEHIIPVAPMGREVPSGSFISVVGHFTNASLGRKAMGIDWMTRNELSQAIPPAYTKFIGDQLMAKLRGGHDVLAR